MADRSTCFCQAALLLNVILEYAGVKCPEDKPYIESFSGSCKTEEIYRHAYREFAEAMTRGDTPTESAITKTGCTKLCLTIVH